MLRAARRLVASLRRPRSPAGGVEQRHLAWDRDCRARGMTAREQADELQIRCAWVRLRAKASAAALRRPSKYLEILDLVAADEARTLSAIGGEGLAAVFLRAYHASEPLEILSSDAVVVVRAREQRCLLPIQSAPSLVPDLPPVKARQKAR
jgi:hypothetical protein